MKNFFKKLFGKQKGDPQPDQASVPSYADVKTSPLTDEVVQASLGMEKHRYNPSQLLVGSAQSVGKQREHNEDTIYQMYTMLADGGLDLPFGIFMVADGMGGYQYGEVASGTAVRAMAASIIDHMYMPFLKPVGERNVESMQEVLEQGVKAAQAAVVKNAPGGGTTLTCSVIVGDQITTAHVGDSRAYFIYPDGRIIPITKDHSLVRRLVELGQITEQEALTHPNRNVVYRALGQAEPFHPDIETRQIPRPGYLLVCSDGLWGVVSETQIVDLIQHTSTVSDACAALVEAANAAGGPDNISVVLVQYL